MHAHLAIDPPALLGKPLEERGAVGALALGLADRLPLLDLEDLGQVVLVLLAELEPAAKEVGAVLGRRVAPRRKGLRRNTPNCFSSKSSSEDNVTDGASDSLETTVNVCRMSHRKWREIKRQLIRLPDLALLGCSLLSIHIQGDILQTFTVNTAGLIGFQLI